MKLCCKYACVGVMFVNGAYFDEMNSLDVDDADVDMLNCQSFIKKSGKKKENERNVIMVYAVNRFCK